MKHSELIKMKSMKVRRKKALDYNKEGSNRSSGTREHGQPFMFTTRWINVYQNTCTLNFSTCTKHVPNVYQNDSEVCLRVPKMPHGDVRGPQRRSSGTPGAESLIIAESSSKIWAKRAHHFTPLSTSAPRPYPRFLTLRNLSFRSSYPTNTGFAP